MTVRLCHLSELPQGSARGFVLPQTRLLVVHDYKGVHVFLNRCPHLGVPLQWQDDSFLDADGAFIRCATHGALFERDTGFCVQGPCAGASLWQIESRIENDEILIEESELPAG